MRRRTISNSDAVMFPGQRHDSEIAVNQPGTCVRGDGAVGDRGTAVRTDSNASSSIFGHRTGVQCDPCVITGYARTPIAGDGGIVDDDTSTVRETGAVARYAIIVAGDGAVGDSDLAAVVCEAGATIAGNGAVEHGHAVGRIDPGIVVAYAAP